MFRIAINKLFELLFSRVLGRPGFDSRPRHVSLGTSSLGWRWPWSSLFKTKYLQFQSSGNVTVKVKYLTVPVPWIFHSMIENMPSFAINYRYFFCTFTILHLRVYVWNQMMFDCHFLNWWFSLRWFLLPAVPSSDISWQRILTPTRWSICVAFPTRISWPHSTSCTAARWTSPRILSGNLPPSH